MNGHDIAREQNMEARIRLIAARRELADAINDATTGIGFLTCDDPQTMNQIRAYWKRIHDRYLETDSLIADLEGLYSDRAELIRRLADNGVRISSICEQAGLNRQRVYAIRKGGR